MLGRLGFVASVLSQNLSTSRTCRLTNATEPRLRELILANLAALDDVVSFLERHEIGLYRITSNLIPFASHPVNRLRWWEEFAPRLDAIGRRLHTLGVRVSTHPGQYTVLNSPHDDIVRASTAELEYHARLLDLLRTDCASKIVLHIGGRYGAGEEAAMHRFVAVATALPEAVRRRLVVESDDRLFDAEKALWVAERVRVPVVFDWLHHLANPCRAARRARPLRQRRGCAGAAGGCSLRAVRLHARGEGEGASPAYTTHVTCAGGGSWRPEARHL